MLLKRALAWVFACSKMSLLLVAVTTAKMVIRQSRKTRPAEGTKLR
jgi:hypothetical protein